MRHRLLFFRELGQLVDVGTPLPEALEDIGHIIKRGSLAKALDAIRVDVRQGTPLHTAMARHKHVFDDIEVALMEAAAVTGNLAPVCRQLAERIEIVSEVRSKLLGGLVYPALVALSACVLLPLPLIVQASVATFLKAVGVNVLIYAAVVAGLWSLPGLFRRPGVAKMAIAVGEKVPWIGGLIRDRRFMLVYTSLGAALQSGVPLPRGLALAGKATGEPQVISAMEEAATQLSSGAGLAAAMQHVPGVSDEALGLLRSGEKTGGLDIAAQRQGAHHTARYRRGMGVLGQVARFGGSLLVASVVAISVAGQFTRMLGDPMSMMPAAQRQDLERELKRATPQLRPKHRPGQR